MDRTGGDRWTIEFYEDDAGQSPVERWLDGDLGDVQHAALTAAIEHVLAPLGIHVCGTPWGKQLGGGIFEFRIRHTAAEITGMFAGVEPGPDPGERVLLRVFCHAHGQRIVLLLHGYEKRKDASQKRQQREIGEARKRLRVWQQRQAREAKKERNRKSRAGVRRKHR